MCDMIKTKYCNAEVCDDASNVCGSARIFMFAVSIFVCECLSLCLCLSACLYGCLSM